MSLENILESIGKEKKVAETDLSLVSPRARPYKKGQVESAKERLETLYIDYKNEILRRAVFILVTGDQAGAFAEIAKSDFGCFTLDAKTMFKEIVGEISPQLYQNKKVNASVFDVVDSVLENKMKLLDVVSYNGLTFSEKYMKIIKNEGEMVDVTAKAITDIVGSEVVGLDALERVAKEAVNKNYKSRVVPILLFTKDENFIVDISTNLRNINPRVVRIVAGEAKRDLNPLETLTEIDKENVGNALKNIAANA